MAKAGWGERIKARARELGLTDAAVARALDLPQRRYSAYVNEAREPDFATLLRVCRILRKGRRCLTPLDAFYAWQATPTGKQSHALAWADGRCS